MLKRLALALLFCAASAGAHAQALSGYVTPGPNLFDNPYHTWDQRNEGASIGTGADNTFVDDRWFLRYTLTTATLTSITALNTDSPASIGKYSDKITVNSGAALAAGDFVGLSQKIESPTMQNSGYGTANAQTISVQQWFKSSIANAVVALSFQNSANTRNYTDECTLGAASTWSLCTWTVPGDTSGTWITTGPGTVGIRLQYNFGCGSTFQTTTKKTWQTVGSAMWCTSATTNLAGTSSATMQLGPGKFEFGPATAFQPQLQPGLELPLLQRYYRKSFIAIKPANGAVIGGASCAENPIAAGETGVWVPFQPPMATSTPTVTEYAPVTGTTTFYDVTAAGAGPTFGALSPAATASGFLANTSATSATIGHVLCVHWAAETAF